MARLGEAADPKLTEKFLQNILPEDATDTTRRQFEEIFNTLFPNQQTEVLQNLELISSRRSDFPSSELATMHIGKPSDILGTIMKKIIPDMNERITFWENFLDSQAPYRREIQ